MTVVRYYRVTETREVEVRVAPEDKEYESAALTTARLAFLNPTPGYFPDVRVITTTINLLQR